MPPEAENIPDELPDDLTAEQILKHVGEVYANCATYEDAGVVEAILVSAANRRYFHVKPFTTVFERSGRFRYEYTHGEQRYIVWADGKRVKTWWNPYCTLLRFTPAALLFFSLALLAWLFSNLVLLYFRLLAKGRILGMALAGATGVSGGSAHMIPALLLPNEVTGFRVTGMTDATRLEDGMLEDIACFRIQGKFKLRSMLLWIDCATFLVRRIDGQATDKKLYVEDMTTVYPIINQPIDPRKFEFKPPRKRTD